MDEFELFANEPEERVAPKDSDDHLHEKFIPRVFFVYMNHFVLENLLADFCFQGNVLLPNYIVEK